MSTVVGAVIRALERCGLGGVLAALTLNLGWAVATVFATPVIMAEGTLPVATCRRSAGLVRRQFTVSLVSSIKLGLPWIVLGWVTGAIAASGGLIWLLAGSVTATAIGLLLVVIGTVGLGFVGTVSSALTSYLEAFLYRYAVGLSVPGVDRRWLPPIRPS